MTDEQITQAARQICAAQAEKRDDYDWTRYLSGDYDHTIWMRLVEQGIRVGIASLVIPKPEPDLLAEVFRELQWNETGVWAKSLRAALDARGLEIREKGRD